MKRPAKVADSCGACAKKPKHDAKACDFLLKLPLELVQIIVRKGGLSRNDVINISMLSSAHRTRFYRFAYEKVKLTWADFKRFNDSFKQKQLVQSVRVFSDLENPKATNFGEWNISLRDILLNCPNLCDMTIEVMTSARCLKYQDTFDVDLSDKITSLSLISHACEAADESLFELSQIQRFHNITKLTLNGFFVSKDQYFYPKFKPDLSDFRVRSEDGRLLRLDTLELVNCRWDHPFNLSDVFSPTYPSANPILFSAGQIPEFTAPSTISLHYSEESSSFVVSERFQSFIDNDSDEQFLFQTRFYNNLKHLKIVILYHDTPDGRYRYCYPSLSAINLKRKFQAQSDVTGDIETRSILTELESLILVGWRLTNVQELDKIFRVDDDLTYNMEHLELYIKQAGNNHGKGKNDIKSRLDDIFNAPGRNKHHCEISVGYAEDCLDGHCYDGVFSKLH
ncbi:DEKNAAC104465 [Brettanomyces naardenensis]|uniref:DEKNAAC104465 n=1 Tax=Brettanomyces naardenensis TaxID=13370 RepID=A0A448YRL3_BRENA|nr:DEKNAAC104465 [Brettanomyces naardenensis]